jgi:hypothetical protein
MSTEYVKYIEQRMKELGHIDYNLQSIVLDFEIGVSTQSIKADNEYLYLISGNKPADVIIHSDSNLYFLAVQKPSSYIPQEFSGLINIESSASDSFSLEFIRVTPK